MNVRQPGWNRHEAVILLDGYLEVLEEKNTRQQVIKRVSHDLRQMAANQGIMIDEIYRNENGIFFQMRSMESAYQGRTIDKPATQLFTEIVVLYRNSRTEYESLLKEARAMATATPSVEEQFKKYLASKIGEGKLQAIYWSYKEIESFCQKIRILRDPLFETTDFSIIQNVQRTIERNKLFKVTHRKHSVIVGAGKYYYDFIKEEKYLTNSPVTAAGKADSVEISEKKENAVDKKPQPVLENNTTPPAVSASNAVSSVEADILVRSEQDTRLLHKYPIIYKRVFFALKELSIPSDRGVSTLAIYEQIKHIGRCADIEDILDNASWSKEVDTCYRFSTDIVTHEDVPAQEPRAGSSSPSAEAPLKIGQEQLDKTHNERQVDFYHLESLAFTSPLRIEYFGETVKCKSWTDLYVAFFSALYEDYPHQFTPGKAFFSERGRIDLGRQADIVNMIAPKPIPNTGLYLETNISATDIVARIRMLLDYCAVDYENVVVTYNDKRNIGQPLVLRSPKEEFLAVSQANPSKGEKQFYEYMQSALQMAEATCRSYISAIRGCEKFAAEHGYASKRIYDAAPDEARMTMETLLKDPVFLSFNAQQHNRFRAAMTKYVQFLGGKDTVPIASSATSDSAYQNEEYEAVMRENFSKGFRIGSPIEIRRFRKFFAALHGRELEDTDDVVERTIRRISIIYENKAFLPQLMVSPEIREKLFAFIEDSFNSGKKNIYFQAIFAAFSADFLDCHIYDAEMLRTYLLSVNEGRFYIGKSSITRDLSDTVDPADEVREFLIQAGKPVTYEEMYASLAHLPQDRIRWILASNAEFINNAKGCYFHQSCLHLTEEELEDIADIIAASIDDKEFISGTELYKAVQAKYPYTIENNAELSAYGFRDAIKYRLGGRFSFNGNIISRKGQALTMQDVFADFCKSRDSFTLNELSVLAEEMGTQIYFEPVYANALRISQTQFVSRDRAAFHVEETDAAIDRFCTGNYLGVKKIKSFSLFPEAGFPWNSYLLQHYVSDYSEKYKLIHNGFNANSSDGAIVKRDSGISTFDDLIIAALADSEIDLSKASALQYLCDEGYLARRRYSSIEQLLIKAIALRNQKGA